MIRRPPRSTLSSSSAASDVYKRQDKNRFNAGESSISAFDGVLIYLGYSRAFLFTPCLLLVSYLLILSIITLRLPGPWLPVLGLVRHVSSIGRFDVHSLGPAILILLNFVDDLLAFDQLAEPFGADASLVDEQVIRAILWGNESVALLAVEPLAGSFVFLGHGWVREGNGDERGVALPVLCVDTCLLYTSDAADEEDSVDLGGRRIIKKKKKK
eukprot:TRINITY_DN439_c0_g1_i6.p1 TRINITY_DN439_c0_g1~~TRINITY_DN439_c0_g1_i6.p1  ORF type:complete len:213 (-),score=39.29 TRINITY_DN439_c0_g1_i6:109-747(-)